MDPRGATVGFAWIAIAAISVMFLYMGGITWGTSLVVFFAGRRRLYRNIRR